jgi:hypothetical protein
LLNVLSVNPAILTVCVSTVLQVEWIATTNRRTKPDPPKPDEEPKKVEQWDKAREGDKVMAANPTMKVDQPTTNHSKEGWKGDPCQ